ncbi:MAG: hypothetical protein KDA21_10915 [Phycisphaerales bacterium]|nr:hypothetical protein [Phycisphaerales bacterium]
MQVTLPAAAGSGTIENGTAAQSAPVDAHGSRVVCAASLEVGDVDQDGIPDRAEALPFVGDWATGRVGAVLIRSGADGHLLRQVTPAGPEFFGLGMQVLPRGDEGDTDLAVRVLLPPASSGGEAALAWRTVDPGTGERRGGGLFSDADAPRGAWVCGDEVEEAFSLAARPGDLDGDGDVDRDDLAAAAGTPDAGEALATVVAHFRTDGLRVGWAPDNEGGVRAAWSGAASPDASARGWDINCSHDCFFAPHRPGRPAPGRPGDGGLDPLHDPPGPGITIAPPPPPDTAWCLDDLDGDGIPEGEEDDDCDGIPNREDCDSPCFAGDPACCMDADGNGLIGQEDPGSACYRPAPASLLADVNGDGVIDSTDSAAMQAQPDAGLVILANTLDHDRDGFPDLADGLNLIDHPAVVVDDTVTTEGLIGMEVALGNASGADLVTIVYDASDPSDIDVLSLEPGPGHLRLWRPFVGGRDPRPVTDGGDWIAPGTYLVSELAQGSALAMLVEAVRPSSATGDLTIEVALEVTPPGDDPPCVHLGEMVLTAVEMQLQGHGYGESGFRRADALWAVTPDIENDPLLPFWVPGSWMIYRVVVRDPRGPEHVHTLTVGDLDLPLVRTDGEYRTPPFCCRSGPLQASDILPGFPTVTVEGAGLTISYNPSMMVASIRHMKMVLLSDRVIARIVDKVVEDMRKTKWRPTNPANPGEFGSNVHLRTSLQLAGKKRWYTDVYVDNETRVIRAIGARPANITGTTQIDAVYVVERGHELKVGSTYDPSKCRVYDIKTGVIYDGAFRKSEQYARLAELTHDGKPRYPRSKYIYRPGGFVRNPRIVTFGRALAVVGAAGIAIKGATTVHALVQSADDDDSLLRVSRAYAAVERARSQGGNLLMFQAQTAVLETVEYLNRFMPPEAELGTLVIYPAMIDAMSGVADP